MPPFLMRKQKNPSDHGFIWKSVLYYAQMTKSDGGTQNAIRTIKIRYDGGNESKR